MSMQLCTSEEAMASMTNYGEEKAQMEEHLQFVAREIGRDWKKLGRKLKTGHTVIECIEVEHTTEEERAYQVLVKWWQDKGFFGATKDILIKALKDIGKTSVAQGIGYRDLSSGTCFRSQYMQCSYSDCRENTT